MNVINGSEPKTNDLTEELRIIAEIEQLELQNVEFNSIDGIDDLFIHYGRSDNQLLDEMVSEFGLECPGFDIFNYVDPALDTALDVAEALSAIDCDIRPSDINLNSLAANYVQENSEQVAMLKCQLKHQQEMISDLQKHLNVLVETHGANPETLLEEANPLQHQTQFENEPKVHVSAGMLFEIPEIDNAPTNERLALSDSGQTLTEAQKIDSVPYTDECDEGSVFITRSKADVAPNVEPHPAPLHADNNFNRIEDSLQMKIRIAWNGSDDEKQFTCQLIGSEESAKAARDIREIMLCQNQ